MIIESINWFERKDRKGQAGLNVIDDIENYDMNPPFVIVENELEDGILYVSNEHYYDKPKNKYPNIENLIPTLVGCWRITYKPTP